MQWFLPFDSAAPVTISKKPKDEPSPTDDPLLSPVLVPVSVSTSDPVPPTSPITDRHVSFSLGPETKAPSTSQKIRFAPPPCLEGVWSQGSSIHSGESGTLVTTPSPHVSSVDLPPLDNIPLLPFGIEIPPVKPKGLPGLGPPPVSFSNPFKSRRWSSSSSSKVPCSPTLGETSASPAFSDGGNHEYISPTRDSKRSSFALPKCFGIKSPRSSGSSRSVSTLSSVC
jgi:hypothetical protein